MKSEEIEDLLELKEFLISVQEWFMICGTSPQIRDMYYDREKDEFYIETDDRYVFHFKVQDKEKERHK